MVESQEKVEEWANCTADAIIKLTKALDIEDRVENTKEFYIYYLDWAKISIFRRA